MEDATDRICPELLHSFLQISLHAELLQYPFSLTSLSFVFRAVAFGFHAS